MRKVIGIVGEESTDYMVIKEVIDHISGEGNEYRRLQPEPDMAGRFGNGWKGVWKWCETNSSVLDEVLHEVTPQIDLLVVRMDGDVSRKEREVHCLCGSVECEVREESHPLRCAKGIYQRREAGQQAPVQGREVPAGDRNRTSAVCPPDRIFICKRGFPTKYN